MAGNLVLAFLAGGLSILSPCVLPIVPIAFAATATESRWGPAALAAGVALAFVAVGLFVATIGFGIGLDADVFRAVAAAAMIVVGAALVLPRLGAQLATAAGPVVNWADQRFDGVRRSGPLGPLLAGLLLGTVWSPCVGPTLGAASLLAAQGRDLPQVALTMLAFGLGAAVPLAALGMISRETLMRSRGRMLAAGQGLKTALGALLALLGVLVLTGLDKRVEAALVQASPQWLTDLTTRF
jgi:cytochrome c biogenesis protein CcdA